MDDYFKETGDAMEDYSFRVGFGYDIEEGKEYYNTVANHIYGESHVSGGNLPDWGNHCGTYWTICDWNRGVLRSMRIIYNLSQSYST